MKHCEFGSKGTGRVKVKNETASFKWVEIPRASNAFYKEMGCAKLISCERNRHLVFQKEVSRSFFFVDCIRIRVSQTQKAAIFRSFCSQCTILPQTNKIPRNVPSSSYSLSIMTSAVYFRVHFSNLHALVLRRKGLKPIEKKRKEKQINKSYIMFLYESSIITLRKTQGIAWGPTRCIMLFRWFNQVITPSNWIKI